MFTSLHVEIVHCSRHCTLQYRSSETDCMPDNEYAKNIFFDIDDTLYRKYTDTLRPSVAKAMEALKARGILTAIATGRPPVAIPGKVKTLIRDSGIDMLVTINGQYTTFHGEVLQAYPMIEAEVERMCTFFDSQYIDYAFVNNDEIVASAAGEG